MRRKPASTSSSGVALSHQVGPPAVVSVGLSLLASLALIGRSHTILTSKGVNMKKSGLRKYAKVQRQKPRNTPIWALDAPREPGAPTSRRNPKTRTVK
eukprot:scaffold220755_cov24-Tisochrysis_lutea.AAC.1